MLYRIIFLNFAATCILAAPLEQQTVTIIPIISQSDELEPNGTYKFSYETGNGIKREEISYDKMISKGTGRSVSSEEGGESYESDEIHVQKGSYSYTAPDGTIITVRYIADENGFQPVGDHLPRVPSAVPFSTGSMEKSGRSLKNLDNSVSDSVETPVKTVVQKSSYKDVSDVSARLVEVSKTPDSSALDSKSEETQSKGSSSAPLSQSDQKSPETKTVATPELNGTKLTPPEAKNVIATTTLGSTTQSEQNPTTVTLESEEKTETSPSVTPSITELELKTESTESPLTPIVQSQDIASQSVDKLEASTTNAAPLDIMESSTTVSKVQFDEKPSLSEITSTTPTETSTSNDLNIKASSDASGSNESTTIAINIDSTPNLIQNTEQNISAENISTIKPTDIFKEESTSALEQSESTQVSVDRDDVSTTASSI